MTLEPDPTDVPPEDAVPESPGGSTANAMALRAFRLIERALLVSVAIMTLIAAAFEIRAMIAARSVDLADILLMFLYTEVIGMVAVFYSGRSSPYFYPIFIAMTALARLIVLQGKDMAPENILFEAGAVLLLAIAVLILGRARSP